MMSFKGKEIASVGKSCHSKGICILIVNDDVACSNIVFEMLRFCSYEVLHVGDFLDVLNVMWGIKGRLDHVVTNLHNLESDGAAIALRIEEKLNVHVLLMDHGGEKIKSKGKPFSFTAFVVKGLSMNDVDQLWQYALVSAAYQQQNAETESLPDSRFVTNNASLSISEPECPNQTNKRAREKYENNEDDKGDPVTKKARVIWTAEMHQKFLEAIEIIGYEKAVPKKIVELMGIPWLTRENVASHLQKFRGSLKRTQVDTHSRPRDTARGLQFLYPSSVDTFQQRHHIPGLQLDPSLRIYSDSTRNVLLSLSDDISHHQPRSSSCTFVGYRLTSDGRSIEFGKPVDNVILPGELPGVDVGWEIHGDELPGQKHYSPSSFPKIIEELDAFFEDENVVVREIGSTGIVDLQEFDVV